MVDRTPNFSFELVAFNTDPWHEKEHDNWRLADSVFAQFIAISNIKGVWDNGIQIVVGDRYVDRELGTIFTALIAHTTATSGTFAEARTTNPTFWESFTIVADGKGTWTTATAYSVNDFIVDTSRYAICISSHTSGLTFDDDLALNKWVILVDLTTDLATIAADAAAATLAAASGGPYDFLRFTPQTSEPSYARGRFFFDDETDTFVGMVGEAEIRLNFGEEMWVPGRNTTGSTLLNGKVGYISGASGNNQLFSLAKGDAHATSHTIGIFTHDIENNSNGRLTAFGLVRGVNTNAFNVGDILYLSSTTAGELTANKPIGNATFKARAAIVVVKNVSTGMLFVNIDGPVESTDLTITGVLSERKGADVASATALAVLTDGNFFDVTGSVTITSIDGIDATLGTTIKLHCVAAPLFTHHATNLILPGGANIQAAAGDVFEFVEYADGLWRCTNFEPADGKPLLENQGMVFISSASASNDATIDFTGLDDTYDKYVLEINSLVPQTNATTLYARVAEAGPSWKSGASDYRWAFGANLDTPTAIDAGSAADTEIEISRANVGSTAGESLNATITISNPDSTSLNKVIKFDTDFLSDVPRAERIAGAGVYVGTTNAIVGIRILMSSGNITSGEFRLYGIRKS